MKEPIDLLGDVLIISAILTILLVFYVIGHSVHRENIKTDKERHEHLVCVQNIYGEDFILDSSGKYSRMYKCEGINSHKFCNK